MGDGGTEEPVAFDLRARVEDLVGHFEAHLGRFDREAPVSQEIYERHRETIDLRMSLGTAAAAVSSEDFVARLHETLVAWRISERADRLPRAHDIGAVLRANEATITALNATPLEFLTGPEAATASSALVDLVQRLRLPADADSLAVATLTFHHVLPDLVVPLTPRFSGSFFGWDPDRWTTDHGGLIQDSFTVFWHVAREVEPGRFIGPGWRTCSSRLVDNAVAGACIAHRYL